MSHGLKILTVLREEMKRLGRKPSDIESASVIDMYLEVQGVKLKKLRKNAPKPRARDAIFDLLAKIDGVTDTTKLTRHGASRIGGAKTQILEVLPGKTTDEVLAEINDRWTRWCRKHTDAKTQTVMALVTHWAELGGGPKTQAAMTDIYQEPTLDWRRVAAVVLNVLPVILSERAWSDLSPEHRTAILKDIQKNRSVEA